MNDPQPPPARGLVAGKYELVRLIGRGGMGSVWEGRHASLGTHVAIKFIDPEYVGSREAQARFGTEARAAATIQSKHAIQIFDHGVTDDGRPYIVMELLIGEPLDKRIERLARISLQETARILGQVSRALQRAHERGDHPPRPEAREHLPRALARRRRRNREGPRLRHRQDQRTPGRRGPLEQHEDRRRPRHALLHVARTGARPARRSTSALTCGRWA